MSSYFGEPEIDEGDKASGVCVIGCECNGLFSSYVCVFRLWFDELMNLWMSLQNQPSWEGVRHKHTHTHMRSIPQALFALSEII